MLKHPMLAAVLLAASLTAAQPVEFAVLHVNDIHARYEPTDQYYGPQCNGTQGTACFGGMARLATAIQDAKAAADAAGKDTLVLHAGDQFTGTVWDEVYTSQGIQIAPGFLEELGVQAFTVGNHEFDSGPAVLAEFIRNATFPVISCNLDTSQEPELDGLVQPYTILELPRSGVKVGVVGLTTVDTPETSSPGPNVRFLPYNETLPGCVADAKADGAQIIVALTHIGFPDDQLLAADPSAADLDLIVGGHSHTLLYGTPPPVGKQQVGSMAPPILTSPPTNESSDVLGPYPTLILAADGNKTIPIVQALWATRCYLGVLQASWDPVEGQLTASGSPLLLGGANSTNPVAEDPEVASRVESLTGPIDQLYATTVGNSTVLLDGERGDVRGEETNLGDLTCDALLWHVANKTSLMAAFPDTPAVCVYSGGSIRASILAGKVTAGQINDVEPFGDWLVVKLINGSVLDAALNSGLEGWTGDEDAAGRFPQVGGLRYAFDPSRPTDSRLVAAQVQLPDGTAAPLGQLDGADMLLVTNNFLAGGGDFYTMVGDAPTVLDASTPITQILTAYFQQFSPITTTGDGRIVNCNLTASAPLCAAGAAAPPAAAAPAPSPTSAAGPRTSCAAAALLVYMFMLVFNIYL